jgi:uncharacterized protein (DUF58 family)
MIVPGQRLMAWVAVLLPSIAVSAMDPAAWWVPVALYGALAAGAAVDGLFARTRGMRIVMPATVRMSRGREATIFLRIYNPDARARLFRVCVPLPRSFSSCADPLDVKVPAGATEAVVQWKCVPSDRGCFRLDACYFEVSSRLGFWDLRGCTEGSAELRVYPNLGAERKSLAALFLDRGIHGSHARRAAGQGREFEKLREYIAGDSLEDIHWKASAKRGKPVTKVYQVERTQEVYCVLDTSRLSARLHGDAPVVERSINAALTLALAAQKQSDLFGMITFARGIDRFIRAAGGKSHFGVCRDALYATQSSTDSPDFGELTTFIRLRLRRRALLIILTDLADPVIAEEFVRDVSKIRRQHLVLVCIPARAEVAPLFDGREVRDDAEVYSRLAGHMAWRRLRETELSLLRQGVAVAHVDPSHLSAEVVTRYLNIKARQMI